MRFGAIDRNDRERELYQFFLAELRPGGWL